MIIESNSDRSISSYSTCRIGQLGSSCSLQNRLREIPSLPSVDHSSNNSCSNHSPHSKNSQSQTTPPPSTLLLMCKNAVCKCIQSSYSSPSNANFQCTSGENSTTPWLQFMFVFIFSMKMQLLFEHFICILSLIVTRYLADKKVESIANDPSVNVPLVRTASSIDEVRVACNLEPQASLCRDDFMESAAYSLDMQCGTTPQPSAIQLHIHEDSQHSAVSSFTSQTSSQHDPSTSFTPSKSNSNGTMEVKTDSTSELSQTSSFMPTHSDECGDDWGQFTDFSEDDLHYISEDPFMSISKVMLKHRGDAMSFRKLEQLQEEDECDEDNQF